MYDKAEGRLQNYKNNRHMIRSQRWEMQQDSLGFFLSSWGPDRTDARRTLLPPTRLPDEQQKRLLRSGAGTEATSS